MLDSLRLNNNLLDNKICCILVLPARNTSPLFVPEETETSFSLFNHVIRKKAHHFATKYPCVSQSIAYNVQPKKKKLLSANLNRNLKNLLIFVQ